LCIVLAGDSRTEAPAAAAPAEKTKTSKAAAANAAAATGGASKPVSLKSAKKGSSANLALPEELQQLKIEIITEFRAELAAFKAEILEAIAQTHR